MQFLFWILMIGLFGAAVWTADGNVRASIFGLISAVLLASLAQYYASTREIAARHFPEKRAAYKILIDLIFDLMANARTGQSVSDRKLEAKMREIKKQLMVWGSPDAMGALAAFDDGESKSEKDIMLTIDKLLREVRRDLGHDDSNVEKGGLIFHLVDREAQKTLRDASTTNQS